MNKKLQSEINNLSLIIKNLQKELEESKEKEILLQEQIDHLFIKDNKVKELYLKIEDQCKALIYLTKSCEEKDKQILYLSNHIDNLTQNLVKQIIN